MKNLFLLFFLLMLGSCNEQDSESSEYRTDNEGMYALIIHKAGETRFEKYLNGNAADDFVNVQSITKSIMALLIGIAIDKGYIEDELS